MKVTLVPEQMVVPVFAAILTKGVTVVITVIPIALDFAILGEAHVILEVNAHVTVSLFVNALLE